MNTDLTNFRKSEQTQTAWEQEMAKKILHLVHDELYIQLRYLGKALSALQPQADKRVTTLASDGERMYFSVEQLLRVFRTNPAYLNRLYLHTVLHCLFSHLWLSGKRDRFVWGIACDIAAEYVIDHLNIPSLKRIQTYARQQMYQELETVDEGISAAQIYRLLQDRDPLEQQALYREFFADDHVFWPKEEKNGSSQVLLQKKWNKLARQTSLEQKQRGSEQEQGQQLLQCQLQAERSRRSYREFLKKFMVQYEELTCDPEEFDLSYYTYGLQLYQNVPLIEPLESRENKKIRDFAVVLDTSYSTNGELVKQFLKETFQLLRQEDCFFHHAKFHIIQCDEKVQEDIVFSGQEEMDRLFAGFVLKGGGGTDFRPAFSYVNELLENKKLQNLCGLLYFTDGKGIYPKEKPSYKTAFVFLQDYDRKAVPAWAMAIQLEKEEFLDVPVHGA